jgi:hypothetical protein
MKYTSLFTLAFLLLFATPTPARADALPPDDPAGCSIADLAQPGTECVMCSVPAGSDQEDECAATIAADPFRKGYTKACGAPSTSGNAWKEVWCNGPTKSQGCALGAGTPAGAPGALLAVGFVAALGLALRRRLRGAS